MKDTTNRMVMGQIEKDLDKKIEEVEKKEQITQNPADMPPLDLNLEEFFFTGNIQYTFRIGSKFSFMLRLPASEDVANLHKELYAEIKKESDTLTDAEFDIKRMNGIVALSLMKYGAVDLENKSKEERLAFVNKLPAVAVQTISKCYVRLESSASQLLDQSTDTIKN